MLKFSFLNILFYFLIKYIVFYAFLMFKDNSFKLLEIGNIKNGADLFYYLWLILFLPVACMIIFTAPLYFTFKVKSIIYFLLLIGLFVVVEYFIYTYLASQANPINGVYNGVISLLLLFLFFFKSMPFFKQSL